MNTTLIYNSSFDSHSSANSGSSSTRLNLAPPPNTLSRKEDNFLFFHSPFIFANRGLFPDLITRSAGKSETENFDKNSLCVDPAFATAPKTKGSDLNLLDNFLSDFFAAPPSSPSRSASTHIFL